MLTMLCSTADVKSLVRDTNNLVEDDIFRRIPDYSERIVQYLGTEFEPLYESIALTPNRAVMSSTQNSLLLDRPVLELIGVSIDGDELTVGEDVKLCPAVSVMPSRKLCFDAENEAWTGFVSDPISNAVTITITAWTGFKRRYNSNGFRNSGDTSKDALDDTEGEITVRVNNVNGLDADGFSPRFSRGTLFRIDDELFRCIEVVSTTEITALRAQRGTTAAEHDENVPVLLWSVERPIRRAAAIWTHLSYSNDGNYATTRLEGLGATSYPVDMPGEVTNILREFGEAFIGVF